jgi:hypothetical protein
VLVGVDDSGVVRFMFIFLFTRSTTPMTSCERLIDTLGYRISGG